MRRMYNIKDATTARFLANVFEAYWQLSRSLSRRNPPHHFAHICAFYADQLEGQ